MQWGADLYSAAGVGGTLLPWDVIKFSIDPLLLNLGKQTGNNRKKIYAKEVKYVDGKYRYGRI